MSETTAREELAELRKEIAQLKVMHTQSQMRHGWAKHIVSDLETNPHSQYKVHLYGAVYWLANFPLVCALFFGAPAVWLKWGVFITLFYSIYANFSTDYGAMSAAMAAYGSSPLPPIPDAPDVTKGGTP